MGFLKRHSVFSENFKTLFLKKTDFTLHCVIFVFIISLYFLGSRGKNMKSKSFKVLASAALAAGLLAGCSGNGDANSNGGGDAAGAKLGDTVKIGLNFELSGAVADYGNAEKNGVLLAVEQFNAREDKPFTVETVEVDNKSDAAESTTAANRLMTQDGVVGIVGPATSGASIATYAVAEQNQVPVISPSTTQNGAMMNGDTPYAYSWRVCFEDSEQGKAMAIYAADTLNAKKAVVFNETSDYGRGLANAFTEELTAKGGEVVDTIEYNAKDTDFSSFITRIKSKDFDVIYIAGYYNEAGLIIKQAKDDGIDCPIIGADGFDSTTLIDLAGKDYATNVYFTTAYSTIDASDDLQNFIDAYKAKYDQEPGMFAALAYDATNLLLSNLEATGESGEALNESIKNANFDGVTGSFVFNADTHSPEKKVLVVELTQGEQTGVTEVNPD